MMAIKSRIFCSVNAAIDALKQRLEFVFLKDMQQEIAKPEKDVIFSFSLCRHTDLSIRYKHLVAYVKSAIDAVKYHINDRVLRRKYEASRAASLEGEFLSVCNYVDRLVFSCKNEQQLQIALNHVYDIAARRFFGDEKVCEIYRSAVTQRALQNAQIRLAILNEGKGHVYDNAAICLRKIERSIDAGINE